MKAARESARLSLREVGRMVGITAPTVGDYESGKRVPTADTLARIAEALNIRGFEVDEYRFTITRKEKLVPVSTGEQLAIDFTGEYAFSRATVRVSPGRINISFDGATPVIPRRAS